MKRILFMFTAMASAMTGCSQTSKQKAPEQKATTVQKAATDGAETEDGKVNYLTTADFKKKVMDYEKHQQEWVFEGKRPVVIDFYATWCGPCKMMAPVVEECAKEYSGKVDFYKIDVDKEKELAQTFGIQSIPTFLFIPVSGKPIVQMGAMQKEDFENLIKQVEK